MAQFKDIALLLLRLMVDIVFLTSGYKHLRDPATRSKDIGTNESFTIFLGAAELAGGLEVISGVLAQLAIIGLILVMLGAIQKKCLFGTPVSGANRGPTAGVTTLCSSLGIWLSSPLAAET